MQEFLIELYLPRGSDEDARLAERRARAAARLMRREGTPIRFVRAILVPEDETCFHLYAAETASAVSEAGVRSGNAYERVLSCQ